jgi:DnaJ-class molecular chaperone
VTPKGAKMLQLAKHKFAEKYHPDKAQGGRLKKQMYHEIFTDVWSIFDDIEKGKLA